MIIRKEESMDIEQKLRTFIVDHLALQEETIHLKADDPIFELGFVDSLFAMQLIGFIQNEFQVEIENADLDLANFRSIDRMAAFIREKKGG
jgi:methoxymalonate biosynthesis acyl carrier protein